jgi:hypothetical protein
MKGQNIMARKTVEEITDDVTGQKFYAANDGLTTEPYVINVNGKNISWDVMPSTRIALDKFFAGDSAELCKVLCGVHKPAKTVATVDVARRNDVSAWWASTHNGKVPGRVTDKMYDAYDAHIKARAIKTAADAANAAKAA